MVAFFLYFDFLFLSLSISKEERGSTRCSSLSEYRNALGVVVVVVELVVAVD